MSKDHQRQDFKRKKKHNTKQDINNNNDNKQKKQGLMHGCQTIVFKEDRKHKSCVKL